MTKADVIAKIALDLDINPSDVREIACPLIVEFVAAWIERGHIYIGVDSEQIAQAWREEMGTAANQEKCSECSGTGVGAHHGTCPQCRGSGMVTSQ